MRELGLRKLHRYLGALVAPLVLLQAASGLALSLDVLGRWRERVHRFLEGVDLDALALFWNAVLYEVHFGSGRVGQLHNALVGAALLLLVFTGVPIFVKVVARARLRTPAVAEGPEPVHEEDDTVPHRWMAAVLGVVAVALMALDVYVFAAAYRMTGQHVPQFYAAAEVELHAARSRAEFERLVAGDPRAEVERVLYGLERAASATEALLLSPEDRNADRSPLARAVLPLEDLGLRRRVEGVGQGLRRLGELAAGRSAAVATPLPEAAYRRALEGLEASAGELAEALMDGVESDRERFFASHLLLFSAAFLFLVAVGVVFYVYEAGRERHLRAIDKARDIARAHEQRFRGLIRQAPDPLLVFDREGRIVAVSLTAARLLGYPEEELLTLNVADVDPGTSREERQASWGELVQGSPVAVKTSWRHRDGSDLPVVLSLAVVLGDGADAGSPLVIAHARQDGGDWRAGPAVHGDDGQG